ncbi:MAG TPA: NAD(P)(+) transhydrogenase (Re/Si-specific) subunit beta [Geminicoccaceae bacterium]|nr:NAD(P)(+) transhydrogenase (Re/Si-specific) subunit beta [Geminicoccaceae bacterium]
MSANVAGLGYLVASVCFILALRGLSSPATARHGNIYGMVGMALAVLITLLNPNVVSYGLIILGLIIGGAIGVVVALRIQMTAMPQLVAGFHSLVGLAAVLVAAAALYNPAAYGIADMLVAPEGAAVTEGGALVVPGTLVIHTTSLFEMGLGTIIGAITFTGSIVAFGKLQGLIRSAPLLLPNRHLINIGIAAALVLLLAVFMATASGVVFWLMVLLAFAIGVLLIVPIGGADMPVVISMLNSYSGWAAAGIGFTLGNPLLIITGALVGSSGAILSYIMCRGMNRSFVSVILGGFGEAGEAGAAGGADDRPVKAGSAEDAAFMMKNARGVIVVPGYGMAVAQAQHAVRELYDGLTAAGVDVKFAIHPVAGRMPGHMNVLLAEANIPYDVVHEMEEINRDFQGTDVAYVIGANDITNPAAKTDPKSPIAGMPVLDVEKAGTVLFIKRSMAPGDAGIQNELFFRDNTMMLFGDAKKVTEEVVKAMGTV